MTDEPMNQYEDETDAVRAGIIPHDSVYCEHGTYVGSPYGGDYLCGYCEDGVSMAQLRAERAAAAAAGELCQPARGSHQRPDGRFAGFTWVVSCVPVGPCPHWAMLMARDPVVDPDSIADFWTRAGLLYYPEVTR